MSLTVCNQRKLYAVFIMKWKLTFQNDFIHQSFPWNRIRKYQKYWDKWYHDMFFMLCNRERENDPIAFSFTQYLMQFLRWNSCQFSAQKICCRYMKAKASTLHSLLCQWHSKTHLVTSVIRVTIELKNQHIQQPTLRKIIFEYNTLRIRSCDDDG